MENIILHKTWVQGSMVIVDNLLGSAFTGESGAHTFIINGVDAQKQPISITGTITGSFLAPNNVTIPLEGSIVNGMAQLTLTEECYDVSGRFVLSIYATNDDTRLCIYCAVGTIFKTESDIIEYPSAAIPDVAQLIEDLQYAIDSFPADLSGLLMAIAPSFNKNTAYTAGQYVWYYGGFYRFTQDHPAGVWNPGHAIDVHLANDVTAINNKIGDTAMGTTATTITGAVKEINDAQGDLKNAYSDTNLFDSSTTTDGKRINGSGGDNDGSDCFISAFIPVIGGVTYQTNSTVSDIKHRIAFYTSNSTSSFIPGELYEVNTVKAPETATYMRFCGLLTEKSTATVMMLSACDYELRNAISEDFTFTNLLSGTTWSTGWISQTTGELDTSNQNYTTTDYIAVTGGKYIVSSKNNARCEMFTIAAYDSGKTVIPGTGAQVDGAQGLTGYFKLPSDAAYVRITYRTSVYASSIVVYEYTYNLGYDTDGFTTIKDRALSKVYAFINESTSVTQSAWNGKTFASYGDSQTNQNKWQPLVAQKLGMTSQKYGVSGATIAVRNTNNTGDCLSSSYRLGLLDTFLDGTDFDTVLIMGGTNDWRYDGVNFTAADGYANILIGENTDTGNTTFKGALKAIVAHLQARYPSKQIVLMSNIGGRAFNDPSETPQTDMTAPLTNANGYTQATFAQATKEIAEYIGVPFIDVYSCGINIYNTAYYLEDGLHINSTTGAKKVADCVISGLQSIQPYTD